MRRTFALGVVCTLAVVLAAFMMEVFIPFLAIKDTVDLGDAGPSPITFRVYVCTLDVELEGDRNPFDVCRAKLVGCPTGSGKKNKCENFSYSDGIEMTPSANFVSIYKFHLYIQVSSTQSFFCSFFMQPHQVSTAISLYFVLPLLYQGYFEVTTSLYKPGDEYAFAIIQAGCPLKMERECMDRGGEAVCEAENKCPHKYDGGAIRLARL